MGWHVCFLIDSNFLDLEVCTFNLTTRLEIRMNLSDEELQALLNAKRAARLLRERKYPVVRAIPHAAGRREDSLIEQCDEKFQGVANEA